MDYTNELSRPDVEQVIKGCDRECTVCTGVSIPLEIEPEAHMGRIDVDCCGDPEVETECTRDGKLRVVITQKIIVKIPVCYEVKTHGGKCRTDCDKG